MKNKEFKAGDYIVITSNDRADKLPSESIPNNTVFKQKQDCPYLLMELDCHGSDSNGWSIITFKPTDSSKQHNVTWRYANTQEIKAYNKAGGPVPASELLINYEIC